VLMMFALMLWFAPQMTLVLLFLAPGVLVPLLIIIRKQRAIVRNSITIEAGSITHINQSILGIKTIQSFGMEELEMKNMGEIEDRRVKLAFKSTKLAGSSWHSNPRNSPVCRPRCWK